MLHRQDNHKPLSSLIIDSLSYSLLSAPHIIIFIFIKLLSSQFEFGQHGHYTKVLDQLGKYRYPVPGQWGLQAQAHWAASPGQSAPGRRLRGSGGGPAGWGVVPENASAILGVLGRLWFLLPFRRQEVTT